MIRHMRHGSPPRLMALQSILSPNRRESLPTPSAGVRITGHFTRRHRAATRHGVEADARPTADRELQDDPVPTTLAPKTDLTSKHAIKPEPAPPARAAQVSDPIAASGAGAPLTRDERLLKLQDALHAHARSLASNSEPASGAPSSAAGLSSPRPGPAASASWRPFSVWRGRRQRKSPFDAAQPITASRRCTRPRASRSRPPDAEASSSGDWPQVRTRPPRPRPMRTRL
jgi:hypothetical protein